MAAPTTILIFTKRDLSERQIDMDFDDDILGQMNMSLPIVHDFNNLFQQQTNHRGVFAMAPHVNATNSDSVRKVWGVIHSILNRDNQLA